MSIIAKKTASAVFGQFVLVSLLFESVYAVQKRFHFFQLLWNLIIIIRGGPSPGRYPNGKHLGQLSLVMRPQHHHLMTKALINQSALVVEESQCPRNFQVENPETVRSPTISLINQWLSGRFGFTLPRSFLQKDFERAKTKTTLG
jgi:hypothetical protein